MPIYNVTIDDASPFITYDGTWYDSPSSKQDASQYRNQTWHETCNITSTASFAFYGTGVYLYGSMGSDHGQYSITVDGHTTLNNGSASPDVWQVPLYNNGNLPRGQHRVIFAPTQPGLCVDLDYIEITVGDGDIGTTLEDTTVDDSLAAFHYTSVWWTDIGDRQNTYFNSTAHLTNNNTATAQVSFNGNAISLYGAVSDNHGPFSVSLDGAAAVSLNGYADTYHPQQLLYRFDGLADGDHLLNVINTSTNTSVVVGLDFAVVSQYRKTSNAISFRPGPLAGIIVCIVLGLLALIGIGIWLSRRRKIALHKARGLEARETFPRAVTNVDDSSPPPAYHAVEHETFLRRLASPASIITQVEGGRGKIGSSPSLFPTPPVVNSTPRRDRKIKHHFPWS